MATLQIDYTSLIKIPLKFNFFGKNNKWKLFSSSNKLYLRHVAKEISLSNSK